MMENPNQPNQIEPPQDPQNQNQNNQEANSTNPEPEKKTVSITDLIKPDVAQQLMEMGFSKNVSEKACLFSNSDLSRCIEWIEQHQADPDFEEEAKVEISEDKPRPQMSAEEAKIKAKELQEKMRKIHAEKEKEKEKDAEKMRIKMTKEMQMAKKAEEERQMKFFLLQKKQKEKEDAEARRQVLEQLERDRAERMGVKYVPKDQIKKEYSTFDNIKAYTEALKKVNRFNKELTITCLKTMNIFFNNILNKPDEEKFRKIKLTNQHVEERVARFSSALAILKELGFVKDESEEFMVITNPDMTLLKNTVAYFEGEIDSLSS